MATEKQYEITYILNPSVDENARGEVDATIDSEIDRLKGSIHTNTEPIRRKLAYSVEKQRVGFARTINATLPPNTVESLRQTIRRMNGVIRLAILQTPPRDDVTPAIFETAIKDQQTTPKPSKKDESPAKKISDAEVEEKIEKALEEDIK